MTDTAKRDSRHVDCVSIASSTCIYLRDGTKIVVGRDADTKGRAWLEQRLQAMVGLAAAPSAPTPEPTIQCPWCNEGFVPEGEAGEKCSVCAGSGRMKKPPPEVPEVLATVLGVLEREKIRLSHFVEGDLDRALRHEVARLFAAVTRERDEAMGKLAALAPLHSAEAAIVSVLEDTQMPSLPVLVAYFKDGQAAREQLRKDAEAKS